MTDKRPYLLMIVVILVALWFGYDHYVRQVERFNRVQANLVQSRARSAQIALLRVKPNQVMHKSHSERTLARGIEQAASKAGIPSERIARIEPHQPRRAGETAYLEHATQAVFEGITLRQLALLAAEFRQRSASSQQLRITALRISAPYQANPAKGQRFETWNVEMTLTYFVYSPMNASPQKG